MLLPLVGGRSHETGVTGVLLPPRPSVFLSHQTWERAWEVTEDWRLGSTPLVGFVLPPTRNLSSPRLGPCFLSSKLAAWRGVRRAPGNPSPISRALLAVPVMGWAWQASRSGSFDFLVIP